MNLLERIEHRLSTWIEGAFRRSIPRQIEPVEVGRALLAAVIGASASAWPVCMPPIASASA